MVICCLYCCSTWESWPGFAVGIDVKNKEKVGATSKKLLSLNQRQEVEEQSRDGGATGWCWAAGR